MSSLHWGNFFLLQCLDREAAASGVRLLVSYISSILTVGRELKEYRWIQMSSLN
jgi:hypothetical protein